MEHPPKDLVIFGLGHQSILASYFFTHDSPYRVVAFTVDSAHRDREEVQGLPVVAFEDLARVFPPERCVLSLPLGWRGMNGLRAEKFAQARALGYGFASYVSSRALVWPDLIIGDNCMILDGVIIQPNARIGDNCNIRAGALISHDAVISDHCFIAARAVIAGFATVGERCVLGLSSTIRDDRKVAPRCFIGAGAVVVADTEENGVYLGVPAKRQAQTVDQLALVR
jgi:sugar O-acyltransferase (sialic acid O-acetyltransferase NeuD family)